MHSTRSYGSLGICFLALVCFLISIAAVDGANLYPQVPSSASFTPSYHLGSFILTPNLRIVVHKDPLVGAEPPAPTIVDYAQSFWSDLSAVASFSLPPIIVVDNDSVTPGVEDSDSVISISVNTTLSYQYFNGKPSLEGYDIRVTPSVFTIQAASPLGVWWGTRTVIQQVALSLENLGHASEVNDTNITLPLGYLSDSPGWEVRGFMLDAGRHWFDAGFLGMIPL